MASKKTIEIVKSTAPVLQIHGEAITREFYKTLFEKHPDLKNIFNMVNQKKGTQQRALANAVFQYAVHIEKLEMLGDAVETITQKHVSLSVPKEAYPIVGEHLLAAIKTVLGAAATPEIINAWAEAYNDLAVIFVSREEELYSTREKNEGGFRGTKEFIVVKKEIENNTITSFYLQRKDGTTLPNFIPGQYIAVTVKIPGTKHKHTRNYSLSDTNDKDYLRLSIKKEEGNLNGIVSNYIHSSVNIDDLLTIGMPSGNFTFNKTEKPIIFISGGIGITPLLSMYKTIAEKHSNITFIQCVLNSKTLAFEDEIKKTTKNSKYVKVFSTPSTSDVLGENHDYKGFLSSEILNDLQISNESEFYFCGPIPFMTNTLKILTELKVSQENINYEFFGPTEDLN